MEKMKMPETKGVTEVVTCRAGAGGCPMAIIEVKTIAERLAGLLAHPEYKRELERKLAKPFNFHSQFCAAVTGCPNACAQPQVRDFGVIGRARIALAESLCSGCGLCEQACKEHAIEMVEGIPRIDHARCIGCSDCVRSCQNDALSVAGQRYEVTVGGKLGRHAKLAESLGEFETIDEVVECLRRAIELLIGEGEKGERLGALLERLK
ncbi:MAG: 4Fe-4S binding protein [Candidatus Lindowbacteria bacterium]|nr:4Fe-4S binding protein [Candidatus Lindowbacteria bacterium]